MKFNSLRDINIMHFNGRSSHNKMVPSPASGLFNKEIFRNTRNPIQSEEIKEMIYTNTALTKLVAHDHGNALMVKGFNQLAPPE